MTDWSNISDLSDDELERRLSWRGFDAEMVSVLIKRRDTEEGYRRLERIMYGEET